MVDISIVFMGFINQLSYRGGLTLYLMVYPSIRSTCWVTARRAVRWCNELSIVGEIHMFQLMDTYNVRPPFDSQVGANMSNNYGLW